jgi:hypothetical protein
MPNEALAVGGSGYLSASLCHSCSILVIIKALSNFIEPFGNKFSSSKKLDFTCSTVNGRTSHLYALSLSPSNFLLFGEYPTAPFSKKSDTFSKVSKIDVLSKVFASTASIEIFVLSELVKSI